ncbi:Uncharacterised protein [Mycobacterium tuberculosis]|nr:Uncharacterised protein [Mycobacterium tuberculosis]
MLLSPSLPLRPSASATGFQSASVVVTAERALPAWPLPAPPLEPELHAASITAAAVVIATILPACLAPAMRVPSIRCIHGVDGSSVSHGLSGDYETTMKLDRTDPGTARRPHRRPARVSAGRRGSSTRGTHAHPRRGHQRHRPTCPSAIATGSRRNPVSWNNIQRPSAAAARRARARTSIRQRCGPRTSHPLSLLTTELELALRRPRSNPELLAAIRSALAETTDTARTTGGTGLGLAIVDTLSQRNHASVTARNRAAGGAEISLRLALG